MFVNECDVSCTGIFPLTTYLTSHHASVQIQPAMFRGLPHLTPRYAAAYQLDTSSCSNMTGQSCCCPLNMGCLCDQESNPVSAYQVY